MKKYQIVFSVIFISIFLLLIYLDSLSLKKARPVYIQDLNVTMTNFADILPVDNTQMVHATHQLWGMKISKVFEDRELQRKALEKLKNMTKNSVQKDIKKINKHENINITHRTICIEKKCWLFVGKVDIGNLTTITLLSKETIPKLETYKIGDYLSKKTKVIDIKGNEMFVLNEGTNKSFSLKLFDISISQYKPK
jgi:hypothetical protein